MPLFQNRFGELKIPVFGQDGVQIDASTLTAAELSIYDCQNVKRVEKTLANGGLTVISDDGFNILFCRLTADETEHLCGQVPHELKIALTGAEYLGITADPPKITFIKTKG